MKKYTRGFTLIELLVVIAIIGILASVVLVSLGTARSKGADAAIKENLSGARSGAELFASDSSNSYAGVCTASGGIGPSVTAAAKQLSASNAVGTGAFTYSAAGAAGSAVCHDSSSGWVAMVSLKSPATDSYGWCVDSNGASREAATLGATDMECN